MRMYLGKHVAERDGALVAEAHVLDMHGQRYGAPVSRDALPQEEVGELGVMRGVTRQKEFRNHGDAYGDG